ncbi:MAG: glycine cleavage system protein H [Hyphomicrobiaceae bacterium]
MAIIEGKQYPEHLYYDLHNQIWYEPLDDDTIRVGFTPIAIDLAGEVLVFTPKRVGKTFEAQRSFAIIECGKWVGAARAAFSGIVIAANADLEQNPSLLNDDAFGKGWMLIVRSEEAGWSKGLVTGTAVGDAFAVWIAAEAYKGRTG